MIQRWLFETPWWLLAALAVAAVALLVSGNNRQNARLKLAGVGVLLLAAILWTVSYFVQTPRELAIAQSREMIAAVVARDRATLDRLLHPKATLLRIGRDEILTRSIKYAEDYGVASATVTSIDADPTDSIITVHVAVVSMHDSKSPIGRPVPSQWQLKWMDTNAGWRLKEIVPMRIANMDTSQLPSWLFAE